MLALATFVLVLAVHASGQSMMMPGGLYDIALTDQVRSIAHFAADTINRNNRRSGENWHTLTSISKPRRQVVFGYIYRMNIVLQESECANVEANNGATTETCPPISDGATKKCSVEVFEQFYADKRFILTKDECSAF